MIVKAPQGSEFNFTKTKAEKLKNSPLPNVGKGGIETYNENSGFGKSAKQVNSGL